MFSVLLTTETTKTLDSLFHRDIIGERITMTGTLRRIGRHLPRSRDLNITPTSPSHPLVCFPDSSVRLPSVLLYRSRNLSYQQQQQQQQRKHLPHIAQHTEHNLTQTTPTLRFSRTMSSDADYAAFLERANQDGGGVEAKTTEKANNSYGTRSVNTGIPPALEQVEAYFSSDADEPFEPIALRFDGSTVSADTLKDLLGGDVLVEEVQVQRFEREYKEVVDTIRKAGQGEVKAFRVQLDTRRAEYFFVTLDSEHGRLIGLKALSIET